MTFKARYKLLGRADCEMRGMALTDFVRISLAMADMMWVLCVEKGGDDGIECNLKVPGRRGKELFTRIELTVTFDPFRRTL